jgi:CheY-like chemotaxis protein
VVDDVQANQEIAKELLESSGMRVDCLISGWQAVERIREGRIVYDAIFMDYMMPGMDGIEAARVIREEIGTEYAQNIPIIALSANSAIGNEKNFLERGFQAFLPKPIDVIQLDYAITKWLRDGALEREYIENQVSGGQGDDVLPPIGSCASWRPAESVPQSA